MAPMVPDLVVFEGSYYSQNSYASNTTVRHLNIKAMFDKFSIFALLQ